MSCFAAISSKPASLHHVSGQAPDCISRGMQPSKSVAPPIRQGVLHAERTKGTSIHHRPQHGAPPSLICAVMQYNSFEDTQSLLQYNKL